MIWIMMSVDVVDNRRNLIRNVAIRNVLARLHADWLLDVSSNHKMSSECFPK
jgi:hypothetical protein